MIQLYQISLILFSTYLFNNLFKFGVLQSISETSYLLGLKNGNQWWYGWIVATVLPLLIFWLEITQNTSFQPFIFLACAGLLFVGVTGRFRNSKHENTVHLTSAFICAIMASIWCMLTFKYMIQFIPLFFGQLYLIGRIIPGHIRNLTTNEIEKSKYSHIFWVEFGAFLITYFSILKFYLSYYL